MSRQLAFLLTVLLLKPAMGLTQVKIAEVRFIGNVNKGAGELSSLMRSQPNSLLSHSQLQADLDAIVRSYQRDGYLFATTTLTSVDVSEDSSQTNLTISVVEGTRLLLGTLTFSGNSSVNTLEISQAFATKTGNLLDESLLEADIHALLERYENLGYPFAAVQIRAITIQMPDSAIRLELAVDEGPKVQINEVTIAGNSETKDQVILRETRLNLPERYDEQKSRRIARRLNRLNIFSSVQEPEFYVNDHGGGLLITVAEGNTNTFDGVLGYAPGVGGDAGLFTGLADVTMRNLFGTGRKMSAHWQRDGRNSQEVGLRYIEPWIFNLPLEFGIGFHQRQQDTTYVHRVIDGSLELLVTETFSIGGLLRHETVIPSDADQLLVGRSTTRTAGLTLTYDTRDDAVSPTSGLRYHTDYQIGSKSGDVNPGTSVQRITIDGETVVPMFRNQILSLGLHGRQLTSGSIDVSDLYRFGGTNTLRGYRENQFLGSRIAWANLEYRFLLARRSFAYAFFDAGHAFLPPLGTGSETAQRYIFGYGLGIRMQTALGNVGVSFAFGEGDSFSQGKLHFGLFNEF